MSLGAHGDRAAAGHRREKPLARNPRRIFVEELYTVTKAPLASKGANLKFAWSIGFNALDRVLKAGTISGPRRGAQARSRRASTG
jgi:squalene-hopene/tetraprenyl-beta-curcumene cyclase